MNTLQLKRAWVYWLIMPFLFSCATYRQKLNGYYEAVYNKNYQQAQQELDNNKFIHKQRNKLLYYLEQGKLLALQNNFTQSNIYFNAADDIIEYARLNIDDYVIGNVANPMLQKYIANPHEIFLVHYHKALNYLQQNDIEEAVVEAKRISLSNNELQNSFSATTNKFNNHAFSQILQGLIYEANGEINNAFISYRNAANLYLKNKKNIYHGVSLPPILINSLLQTAAQLGFTQEFLQYAQLFNIKDSCNFLGIEKNIPESELVLFIETGQAPVKQASAFNITTDGNFIYYADNFGNNGQLTGYYPTLGSQLSNIRNTRLTLPVYVPVTTHETYLQAKVNNSVYTPQMVENLNTLCLDIQQQQLLGNLAKALGRVITKKVIEKAGEQIAEEIVKHKGNKNNKKEEEETNKKAENARLITGLMLNIINTSTEKPDTRHWQTLPAYIHCLRVPLQQGENKITIQYQDTNQTINITSKKGLQFRSLVLN